MTMWKKFKKYMSTAAHGGRDPVFDFMFDGYNSE